MALLEHAKRELDRIYTKESLKADGNRWAYKNILQLIKVFSKQGHSGFSAEYVRDVFYKLSSYKALTPLTNDPNEWDEITEDMRAGDMFYQSNRQSSCFRNQSNMNYYYNINDKHLPKWKRLFIKNMNGLRLYKLAEVLNDETKKCN